MGVDRPRLHCHSAFKHYQMYHRNCGNDYDNSVFNCTYNINGGNICGGGFWGGILGGIGIGIGNMLGGLLGGFGMGGFGMGGFGFGMGGFPSFFGGGMNFSPMTSSYLFNPTNFWNINPNNNNNDKGINSPNKKKQTNTEKPEDTTGVNPNDNSKAEPKKLTDEEFNKLIEGEKTPDELDKILNDNKDKLTEEQKGKIETAKENAIKKAKTDADAAAEEKAGAENKFDVNTITLKDVEKIIENIDKISDGDAIRLLGDRANEDDETVAVPRNYAELLLAQKTGYTIKFCKNTGIRDNSSDTVEGTIIKTENVSNDRKKCTVTVQDTYGAHKLLLDFENREFTLLKNEQVIKFKGVDCTMKKPVVYTIKDDKDEYATRSDKTPAYLNELRK